MFSGEAHIQQVFTISEGNKKVPVAGCRCTRGVLYKKKNFKVIRGDEVVYDGTCIRMNYLTFNSLC